MLNRMGCRIVQAEQGIKFFKCTLCFNPTHLLRLIQNYNRAICLNHINGTAGTKSINFIINASSICASGVKCLNVDNHYIDTGAGRKIVQLVQIGAVVNKETGFLPIMLHKILFDTLTDGDRRNNYNEFAPAVFLIQLEHGLDIHIGFTRTGFHLNIQTTPT